MLLFDVSFHVHGYFILFLTNGIKFQALSNPYFSFYLFLASEENFKIYKHLYQ